MAKLASDWVCIGQSGPTVDGREIKASWLTDAAETYDTGQFTAMIWPDHYKWANNYGKVLELKTEKEGETVRLFARLQPNSFYLLENRYGQKLFFSMEIKPNFADTGKAYLMGLAVTDLPASLGTQEVHFNQRKSSPDNIFVPGLELNDDTFKPVEPVEEVEPSWFTRAKNQFFNKKPEEDNMDPKLIAELTDKFNTLSGQLVSLSDQLNKPEIKPEAEQAKEAGKEAEQTKGKDTEFQAEIKNSLEKFGKQLDEMNQRFSQAQAGTSFSETPGPADENSSII